MSYEYSEDGLIENATEQILAALGWDIETAWYNEKFAVNNDRSTGLLGRFNKSEILLERYLLQALQKINPDLPAAAYQEAIYRIRETSAGKLLPALNKEKYSLFKDGVTVDYKDQDGINQQTTLTIFDFKSPENNHFLAVRQLEISGQLYNRRPDVIGFVNGIPLVFFELKNHDVELKQAYKDNFTDYKATIPELFHYNALVILSNGTEAKIGTITSPYHFFHDWKRIVENEEGVVSLETILKGTCDKNRLLDLVENFILFEGEGDNIRKLLAKNHQYLGVNKVVDKVNNLADLERKLGVFWHTQGSGKSYSMVFLCQKILRKLGGGFTFLIVLDRSELETQIYDTFTATGVVGVKAQSRDHLRQLLQHNHRYLFTLIHKFSFDPKKEREYPKLTERSNIIVISDEAHRTQGGIFAQNMRFKALPNASFLGFTGTPLIDDEVELTKDIFGDYVSIYDFEQAINDGATLPLRYLNRGEKLNIENPNLDAKMAEVIKNQNLTEEDQKRIEDIFKSEYPILTAAPRLKEIAKDVVWHFNERGYQGKAMFVALDKSTAVKMYDYIMEYWQEYLTEFQIKISQAKDEQQQLELQQRFNQAQKTEVCVVVSSEQNELEKFKNLGLDIEKHREKIVKRDLEKEFKDENNPFRLVIVCAMWITGFDVPCISTVYLDKPLAGHTLVQTIARANRVYDDEKENGLIVDYGNVYEQLKKAYLVYAGGSSKGGNGGGKTDPDDKRLKLTELVKELKTAIETTRQTLKNLGFELNQLIEAQDPLYRLAQIKEGCNAICLNETSRYEFEAAAKQVFHKYKAIYPEPEIMPFIAEYEAINALYKQLNKKQKPDDLSAVIKSLQDEVDMTITVENSGESGAEIDISQIDFGKLKQAFDKSKQKNQVMFDLEKAVKAKLEKMLQQNSSRLEFYKEYQKIIAKYNDGKDLHAVEKAFSDLKDFMQNMSKEEQRAGKEGLTESELAIFDLLQKDSLNAEERQKVKDVAKQTLNKLKDKVLRFNFWRQSPQQIAEAIIIIRQDIQHLPMNAYPDSELPKLESDIYQYVHSHQWIDVSMKMN